MPLNPTRTYAGDGLVPSRDPNDARVESVRLAPGRYAQGQAVGYLTAGSAASEVQTLTVAGSPTGGTVRYTFDGLFTAAVAHNATAAVVQAALEALPNVGAGNVTVGLSGAVYTVTFGGALANQRLPLFVLAVNGLTGGSSPTVNIAETTAGRSAGLLGVAYNDALSDGSQVCRGFLKYPVEVANTGTHAVQSSLFGEVTEDGKQSAPVYVAGTFLCSQLVGLDANGAADVGRVINGTVITSPGAELRMS